MLSKSLTQFSVDGWGCGPSLLFDLRPNYGGGNEDNGDSVKRSRAPTAIVSQCPWPCSRQLPTPPPLETPGHSRQVWVSLLWGLCSFLLGPGVHKVFFVASKSLFSQSCVSSGGLYGGVNGNLLQESLCHTQLCTQRPWPCGRPLLTRTAAGDSQTLKGRSGSVSVGSPGVHKVLFEPSKHLWQVWVWF